MFLGLALPIHPFPSLCASQAYLSTLSLAITSCNHEGVTLAAILGQDPSYFSIPCLQVLAVVHHQDLHRGHRQESL